MCIRDRLLAVPMRLSETLLSFSKLLVASWESLPLAGLAAEAMVVLEAPAAAKVEPWLPFLPQKPVVIGALAGAALAGAALTGGTLGAEPVFGAGVPLLFWFPTAAALDTLKPGGGWSGGFGPETSAARELFANSCFSSGSHLCPLSLLLWLFKASAVSPLSLIHI